MTGTATGRSDIGSLQKLRDYQTLLVSKVLTFSPFAHDHLQIQAGILLAVLLLASDPARQHPNLITTLPPLPMPRP